MSPLSNKAAVAVLARSAWSPYKKKTVVLAKEESTSFGWPAWWSSSHGIPTSTSPFASKPQPKPTPQNEVWLITAPLRSFNLSPCFHFQIISFSMAPTGLSRCAKTDSVQEATLSPTLKCTPLCTLACLQVTKNPKKLRRCFFVFPSYSEQTNRSQFAGVERSDQTKASSWLWSHLVPVNCGKVQEGSVHLHELTK